MFLVNVHEALGLKAYEVLDMSLTLIHSMLAEYSYMWKERNRDESEDENGDFEWIELPSWEDPTKTTRMKKYADVGSFIK